MDTANTAGTVVAAVLETLGYVAQSRILDDFTPFFKTGGALLYLIAILGALGSVSVFGSYRMGRYLLVGPGLLYFFVFFRTDVGPVVWQIGGEESHPIVGALIGPLENYASIESEPAQVSWFFARFTRLIDHTTREISDLILDDEYNQDLLWLSRSHVLRMVTSSHVTQNQTFGMIFDTLIGQCEPMITTITTLANPRLSLSTLQNLEQSAANGNTQASTQLARIVKQRNVLYRDLAHHVKQPVTPTPDFMNFVHTRTQSRLAGDLTAPDYAALFSNGDDADLQTFLDGRVATRSLVANCGQVWEVLEDAILLDARWRMETIWAELFREDKKNFEDTPENRQIICEPVAQKLHGAGNFDQLAGVISGTPLNNLFEDGPCDLSQTMALFMMRQIFSEGYFGSGARRNKDPYLLHQAYDDAPALDALHELPINRGPVFAGQIEQYGHQSASSFNTPSYHHHGSTSQNLESEWSTYRRTDLDGNYDSAFQEKISWLARTFMQEIYNYSLQIPYWQGALLYLLAIAYPFFAVMLVLPNRASAFFYIPMAWLWVKSWDIGFALVRVFDQILWELVPSSHLPYNALGDLGFNGIDFLDYIAGFAGIDLGAALPSDSLMMPDVLGMVADVDPLFDIYMASFFTSLVLMMVPAVTASVILGTKSEVLANFSQAAARFARESAAKQIGELQQAQKQGSTNSSEAQTQDSSSNYMPTNGLAGLALGQLSRFSKSAATSSLPRSSNSASKSTNKLLGQTSYNSTRSTSTDKLLGKEDEYPIPGVAALPKSIQKFISSKKAPSLQPDSQTPSSTDRLLTKNPPLSIGSKSKPLAPQSETPGLIAKVDKLFKATDKGDTHSLIAELALKDGKASTSPVEKMATSDENQPHHNPSTNIFTQLAVGAVAGMLNAAEQLNKTARDSKNQSDNSDSWAHEPVWNKNKSDNMTTQYTPEPSSPDTGRARLFRRQIPGYFAQIDEQWRENSLSEFQEDELERAEETGHSHTPHRRHRWATAKQRSS